MDLALAAVPAAGLDGECAAAGETAAALDAPAGCGAAVELDAAAHSELSAEQP